MNISDTITLAYSISGLLLGACILHTWLHARRITRALTKAQRT